MKKKKRSSQSLFESSGYDLFESSGYENTQIPLYKPQEEKIPFLGEVFLTIFGYFWVSLFLIIPLFIFCFVYGLRESGFDFSYGLNLTLYYLRYSVVYWYLPISVVVCFFIFICNNIISVGKIVGYIFILIICSSIYFRIGVSEKPLSKAENIAKQNQLEQNKRDEERTQKRLKEKNFNRELISFAQNKIPDLYSAIKETQQMSEEIKDKKAKLTKVLMQLGRDYGADEDIKRYEELLTKLDKAKIEYDEMLKEGYLQYKKFEISSDPAYEKMLENYNNKAKQSLSENVDSFNKMRNQLSEQRNNE